MFEYCKFSKYQGCGNYQILGTRWVKLLIKYEKKKKIESKRCLSCETVLARQPCKFQHLNIYQIKISVKLLPKYFFIYKCTNQGVKSTLFLGKLHRM